MRVDLTFYGAQTLRALRRLPSKRHLKRERHVVTKTETLEQQALNLLVVMFTGECITVEAVSWKAKVTQQAFH